jgi:hypothetical protein
MGLDGNQYSPNINNSMYNNQGLLSPSQQSAIKYPKSNNKQVQEYL